MLLSPGNTSCSEVLGKGTCPFLLYLKDMCLYPQLFTFRVGEMGLLCLGGDELCVLGGFLVGCCRSAVQAVGLLSALQGL
jgi:hypothetical protein